MLAAFMFCIWVVSRGACCLSIPVGGNAVQACKHSSTAQLFVIMSAHCGGQLSCPMQLTLHASTLDKITKHFR